MSKRPSPSSSATTKRPALSTPILRCGQPLSVMLETIKCACVHRCVACCYKILGDELEKESFPIKNVRPETCPRTTRYEDGPRVIAKKSRALTVGDGDLSFSLALVERLGGESVTCTTFESRDSILKSYPDTGRRNVEMLESLGVRLMHGVDAAKVSEYFDVETVEKFDFVVFNFPCVATEIPGLDGQIQEMTENQVLLYKFGESAAKLLKPTGRVFVAHKTKAAFRHWDVPKHVSGIALKPCGAIVFDRCVYPGYINRKARDRKSFPASDAVTFSFCLADCETPLDIETEFSSPPGESVKSLVARSANANRSGFLLTDQVLEKVKDLLRG